MNNEMCFNFLNCKFIFFNWIVHLKLCIFVYYVRYLLVVFILLWDESTWMKLFYDYCVPFWSFFFREQECAIFNDMFPTVWIESKMLMVIYKNISLKFVNESMSLAINGYYIMLYELLVTHLHRRFSKKWLTLNT